MASNVTKVDRMELDPRDVKVPLSVHTVRLTRHALCGVHVMGVTTPCRPFSPLLGGSRASIPQTEKYKVFG